MAERPAAGGADRRVVYSTGTGRVCPECRRPTAGCSCRRQAPSPRSDGAVKISRDRRRRRGKTVTVIEGVTGNAAALDDLAGTLKRLCGSGGTVKDGVIEIQGDHREAIAAKLSELGYRTKFAGG
jgi:translation initiation factor 1